MTNRPSNFGRILPLLVAVVVFGVVPVTSATATSKSKPSDRGGDGSNGLSAAVGTRLEEGPTTALVTVRYADTIALSQASDAALAAGSHRYEQRKDAALDAVGAGVSRIRNYPLLPVMLVRIANESALQRLAASSTVVSIQPDRRNQADLAQSLPLIRQPQVAAGGDTGAGTAVAVLDTGVNYAHAAFGSCTSPGEPGCAVAYAQDFAEDDGSLDDNGHGTNVAGISLGVAPATKILALDVFEGGGAFDSDILDAIEWAIDNRETYGTRALNLSLGMDDRHTSECTSSSYQAPFQLARSVGILPVVAAGNHAYVNGTYQDGVSSPACAPGAMRIGAVYDANVGGLGWGTPPYACTDSTTTGDKITCFSQSGPLLSMLAPGALITAAGITQGGTSQATPHVAGAIAVLGGVKPNASSYKIEQSLVSSGPSIHDARSNVTRHRLDLVDAVAAVSQSDAVVENEGCTQNALSANDDGSTGVIPLPFAVNFFGNQYAELYVNNNGNVTFESPLGTYTPFEITSSVPPIIAPFFADVDTRAIGSREVTYGTTTFGGRPALCVNWVDVGYFNVHSDKTNSFQLLLVDRSNIGTGDFDVIMNYDRVSWETGDASGGSNGFGGTAAAAGYSAGDGETEHFFSVPGSLAPGSLLDSNPGGLIHGSRNSQQPGRYIFPIRNGLAPGNSGLEGTISGPGGTPLNQAPVQACKVGGQCITTRTGIQGHYSISALASGDYQVMAFPAGGSNLIPAGPVSTNLVDGLISNVDLTLTGPSGPPPGTTITERGTTEDGIPILYWNEPLLLQTEACSGGTVSYEMHLGGSLIRSGQMTESPAGSGHYQATLAPLYPDHGGAQITIQSQCPNPEDDTQVDFNVYIDPSGVVVDRYGKPVSAATVTLLRSDTPDGPFEVLPDESPEMSPANRTNPDTTASDGTFGWDVIAGYYKVRAAKAGCTSASGSPAEYAETDVLTIPPPVTNLVLTLDCSDRLSVTLAGSGSGAVSSSPAGISCGADCAHDFGNGAHVTLTPVASAGSTFSGWSGAGCSGAGSCELTLTGDASVVATFAAIPPPLAPPTSPGPKTPAPLGEKCRKGFKKKKVKGKVRCVKKHRKHKKHRKRGKGRG